MDVVSEFERWYEETYGVKVKVNYDTYDSNETMYSKLSSGAVSYDLVIPSDYMIARMREEDMLLPLNFDNIPNYQYIADSFRDLSRERLYRPLYLWRGGHHLQRQCGGRGGHRQLGPDVE